jgi:DNA recombination protein RmuC
MTLILVGLLGFILGAIPLVFVLLRRAGGASDLAALRERLTLREQRVGELEGELSATRARLEQESLGRTAAETALGTLRESASDRIQMLTEAKESLSNQFKTLANDILEEKSKRFSEQNQESLGSLLDPLKLQIGEFKAKVEEVYVQEGKDRVELKKQVEMLAELNRTIGDEARNLTSALKGSNKVQGNYGELILEKVLEASGLRKGIEYHVQVSHTTDEGRRLQPDVVIELPGDRRLVVDSKISLDAYQEAVNAVDDDSRESYLKAHIASLQTHVRGLSDKNYQQLYGLKSLDFVIMFVPLEPAFMMAVTHQRDLFGDAWNRNVLLVSPSTLLFVVRTVAHLWRQEAQTRNAQEIAEQGASLYDKLVGFVEDLDDLGNRLKQAQKSYNDAYKKLSTGNDNAIRQSQKLVKLGVKPKKSLPEAIVDASKQDLPLLEEGEQA